MNEANGAAESGSSNKAQDQETKLESEKLEIRQVDELQRLKEDYAKQTERLVAVQQTTESSQHVSTETTLDQSVYSGAATHNVMQHSGQGNPYGSALGPARFGPRQPGTQPTRSQPAPSHVNGHASPFHDFGLSNGFPTHSIPQFGPPDHGPQNGHGTPMQHNGHFLSNNPHEPKPNPFNSHNPTPTYANPHNPWSGLQDPAQNKGTPFNPSRSQPFFSNDFPNNIHGSIPTSIPIHNGNDGIPNGMHNGNDGVPNGMHNGNAGIPNGMHNGNGSIPNVIHNGNGGIPTGVHNGSIATPSHNSPWIPEFYTHNPLLAKAPQPTNGVSLELMNGPPMRVNTSSLASQIRPDLDFEDRVEQQRQAIEERHVEEKNYLRKTMNETFTQKIEVEKKKHEESIQSLQKTNLELEYKRKESEVKIRHQQEKYEEKYESLRSEIEHKYRKDTEESQSKVSVRFEAELKQQKEKYEMVIEEQKQRIETLTIQLHELNENLEQEKDAIVAKFEHEVKDVEERLRIQKEKTDSELVGKLKSEIDLLQSVNESFRDEVDRKETEKQELEELMKEERKETEENYESQIKVLESQFDEEKQVLIAQSEEKAATLVKEEKVSFEEISETYEARIAFLTEENETLRKLAESNYVTEQNMYNEREEVVTSLMKENKLLRTQLQETLSRKQSVVSHSAESQVALSSVQKELSEAREVSVRLEQDLRRVEEEKTKLTIIVTELRTEIEQLTSKQREVNVTKEEKEELLKEVAKLNEEIDKMLEDIQEKGKKEVSLNEKIVEVEKNLEQKEREAIELKMTKMEHKSKVGILERQNEDLKGDLSLLRKQKLEVDEENTNTSRQNSRNKQELLALKTTNESLLDEVQRVQRKITQAEEEVNVLRHGNIELQQEVRALKKKQVTYQEAMRASEVTESDRSESVATSADETVARTELARCSRRKSSLEKQVSKLKRSKTDYEKTVESLKENIEALESEAMKQIEHNKVVSAEFVTKRKDFDKEIDQLKTSKRSLEDEVLEVQQKRSEAEEQLVVLEKQKRELKCAVEYLGEEEKRIKEFNEKEFSEMSKTIETRKEDTRKEITLLESSKKELQSTVEKMEYDEASLKCNIEELQKESEILSLRISEMNDSVKEIGKRRVSFADDEGSWGVQDLKEEMRRLRNERDGLLRNVNELERKQTKLDISVTASERHRQLCEKEARGLTQKKKELDSSVFTLNATKFDLETKVNELSMVNVEHSTAAQRSEIEMLRNQLKTTRESCDNIRAMYNGAQYEGQSKVEIVQSELKMAEDSLVTLKRERLELEKIISTLLRQRTELEAEVAMVVDAKSREDRDTTALREERLDLDAEVMRLKSYVSGLRTVLSTLEDAREITERELQGLETRKEKLKGYVSGMETSLCIGQVSSPGSWNFSPSMEYVLTPRDDLEKQVVDLEEQKRSLEADLFKLRRKSGDGIDMTPKRNFSNTRSARRFSLGHLSTSYDHEVHLAKSESGSLHKDLEDLTQEKVKLSSELSEMKVRRTDLDTEITNLEYRKLGLEHSGKLVPRQDNGRDDISSRLSFSSEMTQTEEHVASKDFLDYSVEQMQELREKNLSLEEKLGTLERSLFEAKFEMERQTLEYQKELRLLQDNIKTQEEDPEQLQVIVNRLKMFVNNAESSNIEKLYNEIKNEMKELNRKVDKNTRKMTKLQEYSSNIEKKKVTFASSNALKESDVEEISGYIKEAEDGLEGYSKVVYHLQKENGDLMEIVGKLEARLAAVAKSQELLQRKKAILQETLEKVGETSGQDLIEQTNMIFELDKDLAV